MTPDPWIEVSRLVELVLALPEEEREPFLLREGADPKLLREVRELISFEREASLIFPLRSWQGRYNRHPESRLSGDIIGNYRLLSEIGRGGMGAVYLAERADGVYQQKVAVKILQESVFTSALVARFQQERQILAGLSHPGIARLLDGGVSPDGLPYLVLEYVDGKPIDRYCDEQSLDIKARLNLVLRVAEAVQSAHQQLVLHLDLKPANILVTPEGDPRLLDFGIARFLGETEAGLHQAEATIRLLTPRYASPEQAEGAPLGVASDVFSLATLLYRLLTGTLPYPIEDVSPLEAARLIRTMDPILPSDAAPAAIKSQLRGDLDLILTMALRKEPARRYPTVAAFAEDIQRHLSSLPVHAHADSLRYRAAKFFHRNRAAVAASAVVVLVLCASAVAVTHSAIVARRDRATAERRLQDVRGIAHSYVFDLDPKLEQIPGTAEVRHFVLQNAQKYLEAMSNEASDDDDLARETAQGYSRIAQVQETPQMHSLDDYKSADISMSKGIAIQQRLLDKHPDNVKDRGQLMQLMRHHAQSPEFAADIVFEEQILREAWEVGKPLLATPSLRRYLDMSGIAWNYAVLFCGNTDLWNFADPVAALPWLDQARTIDERYHAAHPDETQNMSLIGAYEREDVTHGQILVQLSRSTEARAFYEDALRQTTLTHGELVEDVIRDLIRGQFAMYLLSMHDPRAASAIAPVPKFANPTAKSADAALSSDDGDELTILARIDLELGRVAVGRSKMKRGIEILEAAHAKNLADGNASSELAWDAYRLAEEPMVDAKTRKQLYLRAIEVATEYGNTHPTVLSYAMLIGKCDLGLATLSREHHEASTFAERKADAILQFSKVLAAHPVQPEASRLLQESKGL